MSKAVLMSPHMTREDMYHEALEAFLRTSALYLDLDLRVRMQADPGTLQAPTLHAGDPFRGAQLEQSMGGLTR